MIIVYVDEDIDTRDIPPEGPFRARIADFDKRTSTKNTPFFAITLHDEDGRENKITYLSAGPATASVHAVALLLKILKEKRVWFPCRVRYVKRPPFLAHDGPDTLYVSISIDAPRV